MPPQMETSIRRQTVLLGRQNQTLERKREESIKKEYGYGRINIASISMYSIDSNPALPPKVLSSIMLDSVTDGHGSPILLHLERFEVPAFIETNEEHLIPNQDRKS